MHLRRRLARAALIGVLGLAALGYGALDKTIALSVEGRTSSVRTYALTVGDVLGRAGIRLGPGDWVDPPLGARLGEGSRVEIRRAKLLTIVMNGRPRRVVTTALTVEQVLADLNLRRGLRDFVGPSRAGRIDPGMTIVYRQAVAITVLHDGKADAVITNAADVASVLKDLGVSLGARDRVEPALTAYPQQKMVVKVLRVGDRVESEQRGIDYPTIFRKTLNMEYGTRKTVQPGADGVRRLTFRSTYVDGKLIKRKLLTAKVVREPTPRVVAVGAGFPGCVCNRGSQTGSATWYGAEGLTAAHRTLPFGTVVRVENLDTGAWVNVVIRDRGPYGSGRIIDLSDEAFARIAPLSKGIVRSRIRW